MADVKTKTITLVSEIDSRELAVRIIEAMTGIKRPAGATAEKALAISDPAACVMALRASETAIRYITECINAGSQPS